MNLGGWTFQAALVYVIAAALLYALGGRGWRPTRARAKHPAAASNLEPLRVAAFAAGLITIVVALDGPIDKYAEELFWVHMLQHVLLLTVAPPLILLGRPWPRMWRALPLQMRTTVGRSIARAWWTAPLRALAHPLPAWLLFNATIIVWHIPVFYDATLSSYTIHQLEHAMFFFTGLLFWARVIDPGPLRPRLEWPARVAYVTGAMIVSWVLAITLVLVPAPLYSHYVSLVNRPGGISAITDQQLAGGVMWVLGSISYTIAYIVGFYRWLTPDFAPPGAPVPAGASVPPPATEPDPQGAPRGAPVLTP
jgi:putative membrane protein